MRGNHIVAPTEQDLVSQRAQRCQLRSHSNLPRASVQDEQGGLLP